MLSSEPGFFIPEGAPASSEDVAACREVAYGAEAQPINIHILLDRSVSMYEPVSASDVGGPTRWEAVTSALKAFLQRDELLGAKVSLQFFGLADIADDCSVEKYATPRVALGPLAEVRADVLEALDTTQPGSLTPTAPALRGALQYAARVAREAENAGRPSIVVLASDGVPSECFPTDERGEPILSNVELERTLKEFASPPLDAAGSATQPAVRTYVVGTQELRVSASSLANAGGGQAFLLGAETGAAFEAQFLDALLSIVVKPLTCEIPIPEPPEDSTDMIDVDKVRVRFTSAASNTTSEIPFASGGIGACGRTNAWFYDQPMNPQKIVFCPNTCQTLGAGDLHIELGCSPVVF